MTRKLVGAAVFALSAFVFAGAETKDATTINIEALARVDSITAYCSNVDRPHATTYQQRQATFVRSHSPAEIDGDRGTARYKFALGVVTQQLGKLSPSGGAQACSSLLK